LISNLLMEYISVSLLFLLLMVARGSSVILTARSLSSSLMLVASHFNILAKQEDS
jgi:hypothetical protein